MEALGKFIFPAARDPKPLQPLSAERVNATRPSSTVSSATTKPGDDSESPDIIPSPQSSPPRRARADLFADFHPTNGSPKGLTGGFGGGPQSPSLPEFSALRAHVRTNSDVQGLVKRFEHLDVRDRDAESMERRKKHEAELRRAQIAREEAESDAKRLREEMRQLQKDLDESRDRERRVSKRLEAVMSDHTTAKDSHASQTSVYEKELRKARKEAFKSSSTVLKLQEELKSTRNSLRITQSGFDLEKQKVERKEQERFEMEYRLIPLQEQVDCLTQRLQVVEAEKEAFKKTAREEEVARIAAEGMIALPYSQDHDHDLMSSPRKASPRKQAPSPLSDDKENVQATSMKAVEDKRLVEELELERMKREHAEELAEFLRMECMFHCCQCRSGQRTSLGHELRRSLDREMAAGIEMIRQDMVEILTPPIVVPTDDEGLHVEHTYCEETMTIEDVSPSADAVLEIANKAQLLRISNSGVSEHTVIMGDAMSIACATPDDQIHREEQQALLAATPTPAPAPEPFLGVSSETARTIPLQPSSPITPSFQDYQTTPFRPHPSIRTVTTTTTIPMHFTPVAKPAFPPSLAPTHSDANETSLVASTSEIDDLTTVPATPTFDRAAALAAIEYRRGRARSIANGHATPRKQMIEGVKERRDISAPALGQKSASGSVKGRSGSASRSTSKK